jgi:hypothetical protein
MTTTGAAKSATSGRCRRVVLSVAGDHHLTPYDDDGRAVEEARRSLATDTLHLMWRPGGHVRRADRYVPRPPLSDGGRRPGARRRADAVIAVPCRPAVRAPQRITDAPSHLPEANVVNLPALRHMSHFTARGPDGHARPCFATVDGPVHVSATSTPTSAPRVTWPGLVLSTCLLPAPGRRA